MYAIYHPLFSSSSISQYTHTHTHTHTQTLPETSTELLFDVRPNFFHEAYGRNEHLCSEIPWKEYSMSSKHKFTQNISVCLFCLQRIKTTTFEIRESTLKVPAESTTEVGRILKGRIWNTCFFPADFPLQFVVCCSHYYYYYYYYYYYPSSPLSSINICTFMHESNSIVLELKPTFR